MALSCRLSFLSMRCDIRCATNSSKASRRCNGCMPSEKSSRSIVGGGKCKSFKVEYKSVKLLSNFLLLNRDKCLLLSKLGILFLSKASNAALI